jgi:polyisoprenyl-teichoic acid--peptidoglycan teichoic acid transferase
MTERTTPNEKPAAPPGRRERAWSGLMLLLGVGFALAILATTALLFMVSRDLASSYTGTGLNPFSPSGNSGPIATPGPGETPLPPLPQITPHPWNGSSRVTVLVMGLDYRDWLAGEGAPRSDTMILLSVDPITRTAAMLSIPRDLWVQIPGFDFNRINTAYMLGEAYRMPGGGPALAVRTVENFIGVPIQYFAVIDFHTFEKMIDEIGGIDVLVTERIKIAPIGRDAHWLDPKAYHLDGPDALAYARIRKAAGDDFGRATRQQQVIMAILDRVIGLNMVPTLLAKAPTLYQQLASGVRTNMSPDDIVSLAWLAVQIPRPNIKSGVIEPPKMVGFYTRPDGAKVLSGVPDEIRRMRDELFVATSGFGPSSSLVIPPTPTP